MKYQITLDTSSRSLHGERGLKRRRPVGAVAWRGSLPSRGAWIETAIGTFQPFNAIGRSLHGERGLKPSNDTMDGCRPAVAPFTGSVD